MGTHRKRMSNDTLSRNQDFDLFKQKNKQTSSISLKASKLAVFLAGSEFRLRIPFGKRICFPSPSAVSKLLCLQSEALPEGLHEEAMARKINFSKTLQEALLAKYQ